MATTVSLPPPPVFSSIDPSDARKRRREILSCKPKKAVISDDEAPPKKKLQEKYDLIGDVRGGEGLMTAMELVSDRESKTPIDKAIPVKLQEAVYRNGTMVRVSGPNVILSPPLVLSESEANTVLASLDAGFRALKSA